MSDIDDLLVDVDVTDRPEVSPVDYQQSDVRRKNAVASKQEMRRRPLAAEAVRRKATVHRRRKSVDGKQQHLATGGGLCSVAVVEEDVKPLPFQTADQYSCAADRNPRGAESMQALVAFVNGSVDTDCYERLPHNDKPLNDMTFCSHKATSPYTTASGFSPSLTPPYDGEFDERLMAGSRIHSMPRQWNDALALTSSSPSYYNNRTSAEFADHNWMTRRDCLELAPCTTRTPSDGGYENICTPETPGWEAQTGSPVAMSASVVARKADHIRYWPV
jgi:hypothetical protein